MKIILASDSKKDKDILDLTVMEYELLEHKRGKTRSPRTKDFDKYVKNMARRRTKDVIKKFNLKEGKVVGVHTLVVLHSKILPQPETEEQVIENLKALSGKSHLVLTGICVVNTVNNRSKVDVAKTVVKFFKLSDEEIENYSKIDEWEATPAGYYLHGGGGIFIESIKGGYYNIMGLPLAKIKQMLKE
jgi:septum formation protein